MPKHYYVINKCWECGSVLFNVLLPYLVSQKDMPNVEPDTEHDTWLLQCADCDRTLVMKRGESVEG